MADHVPQISSQEADQITGAADQSQDESSVLIKTMSDFLADSPESAAPQSHEDARLFNDRAQSCLSEASKELVHDCLRITMQNYFQILQRSGYSITAGEKCWLASQRDTETGSAQVLSTCLYEALPDQNKAALSLGSCVDFATSTSIRKIAIAQFRQSEFFGTLKIHIPYQDTDPRRIEVVFLGSQGTQLQDACGRPVNIVEYDANVIY